MALVRGTAVRKLRRRIFGVGASRECDGGPPHERARGVRPSRSWGAILAGGLALGLVLGLQFVRWPAAQEMEEVPTPPKLSEAELELYIAVYSAMQADHDLTIEAALTQRGVALDEFRRIERRVESEQRYVDRVRTALLNQAKSLDTWGAPRAPQATPTADSGGDPVD